MSSEGDARAGLIRASDAEREAAIDVLRDASAEGRLTFEELADRIEVAAAATTRGELQRLTDDLPSGAGATLAAPRHAGGAVAAPVEESAIFGDLVRSGPWRVPEHGRYSTVFGDIELDLREAAVAYARIEIDAGSVFGDVTLLVPEGVVVDVRSKTLFGDVRQKAGLQAPSGAPVVVLTGGTWFGDVRVKSQRLREKLMATLGRARTSAGPARIDRRGD